MVIGLTPALLTGGRQDFLGFSFARGTNSAPSAMMLWARPGGGGVRGWLHILYTDPYQYIYTQPGMEFLMDWGAWVGFLSYFIAGLRDSSLSSVNNMFESKLSYIVCHGFRAEGCFATSLPNSASTQVSQQCCQGSLIVVSCGSGGSRHWRVLWFGALIVFFLGEGTLVIFPAAEVGLPY